MKPRPLRIGLTARLLHQSPAELGFQGKTLQYLEQSLAHWILSHGALAVMVPALGHDAEVERRAFSVREYVALLDGLILQGGADVSPLSYGQQPLTPAWSGDRVRDCYEMELIEGFLAKGKPLFGICRGCQLINVAFGGSLYQDIATQRVDAQRHVDADLYDQLEHPITIEADTRLATLYAPQLEGVVNSIHHQAIDRLGGDLVVESRSRDDGIIESIRGNGAMHVVGVQWHPEFHWHRNGLLDPEPLMHDFLHAARVRVESE